jgi:hypothetical protein
VVNKCVCERKVVCTYKCVCACVCECTYTSSIELSPGVTIWCFCEVSPLLEEHLSCTNSIFNVHIGTINVMRCVYTIDVCVP